MPAYVYVFVYMRTLIRLLERTNMLEGLHSSLKLICYTQAIFTPTWCLLQVLSRLAPFERGIYEDYVANFWCCTSVLIKWKRLFTTNSLRFLSLVATILTFLPSMIQQIWSPSSKGFLYGLLNSSLAFYLFSFQGVQNFLKYYIFLYNLMCSKYLNHWSLNLQFMRSPFCCRFCLQPCWLWNCLVYSLCY